MLIGIDLGGSKIEGLVLDITGQEIIRKRINTPKDVSLDVTYKKTISAIIELIECLAERAGADKATPVGIGIPGSISKTTGKVKNANSTCLIGKELDVDIATESGRPIRVANDADCFTISEATDGAGRAYQTVFGVILGTGCGGGISVNGTLLKGPNTITGEWGHNPMPWPQILDGYSETPGPNCYCGKLGCIETFISGTGLEQDYRLATNLNLTAKEIVALETSEAKNSLFRYNHRLARALASIINILDPDAIILGGGMSNNLQLYEVVPKLWQNWVFSETVITKLLPARHGDSSGVRGAANLWKE
ncbi:MAG: ROK family protein [Pseudomonadota bacterium]|nr:ROK family protein [Pseudomonadota bacterium]